MSQTPKGLGYVVAGILAIAWGAIGYTALGSPYQVGATPAYLVLQILVIVRARGLAKLAAGAPLVVMVPVYALTIYGVAVNSNLWFIFLGLATPLALIYVGIATIVLRRPRQAAAPA